MNHNKIVFPGDKLSTSEELLSGEGTYEEDGIIRATRVGKYMIDSKSKRAIVKAFTSIPVIVAKNDIILAEVRSVRSNMVIAEVFHIKGKKRGISGDTNGTLKVSEIAKSYIKDPSTEFSTGDIIRAKVTQVKPSIQLETKEKNYGAIKSLCSKCHKPLLKKGNILECDNCGNKERRRTAMDYGNFDINNL